MGEIRIYDEPFVDSVFHPTDFSSDSMPAFAHALAMALSRKTAFTVAHVGSDETEVEWSRFPSIRETLERWGLLEKGAPQSAVYDELEITAQKLGLVGPSPLGAIVDYLDENPHDLIVLAAAKQTGLPRWLRPSMAEKLAREVRTMTMFVPANGRGLVALGDGTRYLRRVLVPIDHHPNPHSALVYAARAATMEIDERTEVVMLHVGDRRPEADIPDVPAVTWTWKCAEGSVVDAILGTADGIEAELIVMPTEGRQGILDALRGSVTEQVVRRAPCPVLAVPMR